MSSENINVRVTGALRTHLLQQIGENGLYENTSEYIRELIRRDIKSQEEAWDWLFKHLEPAMAADESTYIEISAKDIIARNSRS